MKIYSSLMQAEDITRFCDGLPIQARITREIPKPRLRRRGWVIRELLIAQ